MLVEEFRDFGVAVAKGVDGNAAGEVEIASVFDVEEVTALAFGHHGRRADIGGDHVLSVLVDKSGGLRVRGRIMIREGGFFLAES